MKKIEDGIPDFNCRFNQLKLKTNFDQKYCRQIEFLGMKIESDTLEVEPDYFSVRYSTVFTHVTSQ